VTQALPLTTPRRSGILQLMQTLRKAKVREPESSAADRLPESGERHKTWDPGPLSNEPEMEGVLHVMAFFLLMSSLRWYWRERKNWFAIGNLSIYYPDHSLRAGRTVRKKLSFRGPDFFVVLGVDPSLPRNSWVVENEGKYPDVIVEILSKSTAKNDRGEKKTIYERTFKTPEYFLYDPDKRIIEGFRLVNERYVSILPDVHGRLWSERLGLSFGMHDDHLRFFTAEGMLVPLPDESAVEALMERELARIRARIAEKENERLSRENSRLTEERAHFAFQKMKLASEKERLTQEKSRLAAKLRSLGIDPDKLD
jgi:Uma2 family endonuclease